MLRDILLGLLASPVVLELIRAIADRLKGASTPDLSQLPPEARATVVARVATEELETLVKNGGPRPAEPAQPPQKGAQRV